MTDKARFSCYIKILYADGRGTSVRVKNGNCVLSIKGVNGVMHRKRRNYLWNF